MWCVGFEKDWTRRTENNLILNQMVGIVFQIHSDIFYESSVNICICPLLPEIFETQFWMVFEAFMADIHSHVQTSKLYYMPTVELKKMASMDESADIVNRS